jgi:hypothetical protein
MISLASKVPDASAANWFLLQDMKAVTNKSKQIFLHIFM